jgi:hypothetical protein
MKEGGQFQRLMGTVLRVEVVMADVVRDPVTGLFGVPPGVGA